MKLLSMPNDDFLSQGDGNPQTISERIRELLKLGVYPMSIQFDNKEDIEIFSTTYVDTFNN